TNTLNNLLGRIQQTMNQMKRFIADASHELRIPLAGLRGTVEVAMRKKRSVEEYEQILDTVHLESERLSELVASLLSLARTDAGELKLEKVDVDLETFLENVFEEAQALNAEKRVTLRHGDIPKGKAHFDEARIHQLLINLIENAIHYNRPGGEIILSGSFKDNKLVLSVKDSGIGISQEDQSKIFDRFYRVDKARSREAGGTGLGLAISRSIAEAHNGTLTVQSVVNEGSEFTLTLPLY
ncbi:MAG: sensor histidine kinase, partial [Elusimicrobiota bacterium]